MFRKKRDFSSTELYVGKGTVIKGDISVEGSGVVEGVIEGNLDVKGELILGKNGKIRSQEIKVGSLLCMGEIITNIIIGERLEFQNTAIFKGDLRCKILVVEEGAKLEGNISQLIDVQTQNKG
ncbi:MAG: polymer-forming cytoskeletal protein [candidate division WOR-3 bacterium]